MLLFPSRSISSKARTQLRAFLNMRPIPQIPVWENAARHLISQGAYTEAALLIELASKFYDKDTVRALYDRTLPIPLSRCGRSITSQLSTLNHPCIFGLRDHCTPIQINHRICLRSGEQIYIFDPHHPDSCHLQFFSDCQVPIPCIGINDFLIFAEKPSRLICRNLIGDNRSNIFAFLDTPGQVHHLCGPLKDGTFFMTCANPIPVLSDICILCQFDFDRIRDYQLSHPNIPCDIQASGTIKKFLILTNIQQTLLGDTCAGNDSFMTCGGGIQNREVRFIYPDGSWSAKCIHESQVIRIMPTPNGIASLDISGQSFLWSGSRIVGDQYFDMSGLDNRFNLQDSSVNCTIDWAGQRLYMTKTPTDSSALNRETILRQSYSCCVTDNGEETSVFIKKIYPLWDDISLVMLADGEYYFWSNNNQSVLPIWQLPASLANARDWKELLKTKQSPSIEEDPRIRQLDDI